MTRGGGRSGGAGGNPGRGGGGRGGGGAGGGGRGGGAGGNSGSGRRSDRPLASNRLLPPISGSAGSVGGDSSCGLCSAPVGEDGIGCDRCDRWYHPSVLCMGIPENVIENIKSYGGDGVSYICTVCRSSSPGAGDPQASAIGQILQTVAKLCENVQRLTEKVDGLLSGGQGAVYAPTSDQLNVLIAEECREMEERKKRASSIVIRGVNARTAAAFGPTFGAVSSELLGSPVQLTDVVCIDADRGLFRAKISDTEIRRKLLDSAKNLKNSTQYSSVFINRDLTYKQRQTLISRRAGSRDQNQNNLRSGGAVAPSGSGGGDGGASSLLRPGSRGAVGSAGPLN